MKSGTGNIKSPNLGEENSDKLTILVLFRVCNMLRLDLAAIL